MVGNQAVTQIFNLFEVNSVPSILTAFQKQFSININTMADSIMGII